MHVLKKFQQASNVYLIDRNLTEQSKVIKIGLSIKARHASASAPKMRLSDSVKLGQVMNSTNVVSGIHYRQCIRRESKSQIVPVVPVSSLVYYLSVVRNPFSA